MFTSLVATAFCSGGRVLMKDLSFELGAGKRILVTGESGTGKSSLLRAIAGLWTTGKALGGSYCL